MRHLGKLFVITLALLGALVAFPNGSAQAAAGDECVTVINNCVNFFPGQYRCPCTKRILSANETCPPLEVPAGTVETGFGTTCNYIYTLNTAQTSAKTSELEIVQPKLQIPIPSFKGFSQILKPVCEDPGGDDIEEAIGADIADEETVADQLEETPSCDTQALYIPYLAEYLGGIYGFLVSIAGILAGIMIVFAGAQWLLAGGDASKIKEAKNRITNAVMGLVLALGSYTLLYLVNPDLVSFKSLRINLINREELNVTSSTSQCPVGHVPANTNAEQTRMLLLPNGSGINGANQVTTTYNYQPLLDIARIMQDHYGITVRVASGARTMAGQLALVKKRYVWNPAKGNYENKNGSVSTLSKKEWWISEGQPDPQFINACVHSNSLDLYAGAPGNGWKKTTGVIIKVSDRSRAAGFTEMINGTEVGKKCLGCDADINKVSNRICLAQDPCQQALIHEMTAAGFGVLMGPKACSSAFEPWHFNRVPNSGCGGSGILCGSAWKSAAARADTAAQNGYSCN